MGKLTDKNILITGGNSGIGLAAAQEFDREGARVAICGLNAGSLQAAKKTLRAGSLAVRPGVSNLTDLDTMFGTIKISQNYGAALIATHTINSAPQAPKSALRGLMQRLGLTLLACTLVIAATASASAADARDEAAVRALGDNFAKAFVQKNAEQRASLFAENGTFVTPVGDFLQGRVAMVKDFGPEAQAVTATTQAAFSNYRVRFIKPDIAVVDALLTVHNVNGPDGTVIPMIPINFFYVAARHGNQWLIEDGRAHFAPAPANSMTFRN